jgi:hypothetical protein
MVFESAVTHFSAPENAVLSLRLKKRFMSETAFWKKEFKDPDSAIHFWWLIALKETLSREKNSSNRVTIYCRMMLSANTADVSKIFLILKRKAIQNIYLPFTCIHNKYRYVYGLKLYCRLCWQECHWTFSRIFSLLLFFIYSRKNKL